jgi:predicted  nucleic acid-binding Zn-ribbon protein
MATEKTKTTEVADISIEEKLRALFELQKVDSEIDKIRILRGELPLEVQDLEDEIAGLETRVKNLEGEVKNLETAISNKKNEIAQAKDLIKKYQEQQNNVRNNREYDSLSKEIEYQTLEIELCEKRIKEFTAQIALKKEAIDQATALLNERKSDLDQKKKELEEIVAETQKEEEQLLQRSREIEAIIEPRLLTAYKKIRGNARNGLAVVTVERDACGGCFNKIPPQRQLDIRSRKKIIVCEYCGRILVDDEIAQKTSSDKD